MAVKRPVEALRYARSMVKAMPIERPDVSIPILQSVSNYIWMAAPWRWTIGRLSDTVLTADTVAHTLTSTPSDLLYIGQAVCDEGETQWPLEVVPELPATKTLAGTPKYIAFVSPATIRIQPPATQLSAGRTRTIRGWYKKTAPTISAETQYTAGQLVMPDEWYQVFQEGVLWQAYLYADDPRAGQVQVSSDGRATYTGQGGAFMNCINMMRASEPLPDLLKPANDGKKTTG